MIDLRRTVIATIKVKPSESKEKDFHLALAEYLYKELKYQGLNVSRRNVILKVSLQKPHQNKYDHLLIDCLEGKLFLRGKEVTDKFFGKLRRFEGQRASDAYHCVVQSASRIINRINKLINNALDENEEREIYAEEIEIKDLRKKNTILDLRQVKTASVIRADLRTYTRNDLRTYIRNDLRKKKVTADLRTKKVVADMRKKKAELIDAFMDESQNYYEVYRNPTTQELENIKNENIYGGVRAVVDNGTVYAWNADILHGEINRYLKDKIYVNDIRIVITENDCEIWGKKGSKNVQDLFKILNDYPILFKSEYKYLVEGFSGLNDLNIDQNDYIDYSQLIEELKTAV